MGKYTAKLIILSYDNFGENHTPLVRTDMAAIPKISDKNLTLRFREVVLKLSSIFERDFASTQRQTRNRFSRHFWIRLDPVFSGALQTKFTVK